jgi:hypothetical protein
VPLASATRRSAPRILFAPDALGEANASFGFGCMAAPVRSRAATHNRATNKKMSRAFHGDQARAGSPMCPPAAYEQTLIEHGVR